MQGALEARGEGRRVLTAIGEGSSIVMPAIIDTHVHLRAEDRDTLVEDLQRKAWLEANPLDDITNTRGIVDVYLRGAAVDRDALSAAWVGGASG